MPEPTQTPLIAKHPADERLIPFANVDVEFEVEVSEPPVRVIPVDEFKLVSESPPANVEVETDVMFKVPDEVMLPPVTVTPFDEERPAVAMEPEKLEVPLFVISRRPDDLSEPPVRVRPEAEVRPPTEPMLRPPEKEEVAVEVFKIVPPVTVSPVDAVRFVAEIPPEKVDVETEVTFKVPLDSI